MNDTNKKIISFINELYGTSVVPLHEPRFVGNEKDYLAKCIDSTFVSSIGDFIVEFEEKITTFTGIKHAIATSNGTTALHTALILCGVQSGEEVLCPALTFVATANAISHAGATPIFVDSSSENLGLSPEKLEDFLSKETKLNSEGLRVNKTTNKIIRACIVMHVFGHPIELDEVAAICLKYNILLIEDAAEALGSYYKNKHVGYAGIVSTLSFNGNKVITTGGGGMILTNSDEMAKHAKHITTTAKVPHPWEFFHDEVGYNYRMPNLNAALGCAQIENLESFLKNKRSTADLYNKFLESIGVEYVKEPALCKSNFWLNAILLSDRAERDVFLKDTNQHKIMTRPIWVTMEKLPMYAHCQCTNLENAIRFEDRVVNLPSSVSVLSRTMHI